MFLVLPHSRLLTTNFVGSSDIPQAMRLLNLNVLLRTSSVSSHAQRGPLLCQRNIE